LELIALYRHFSSAVALVQIRRFLAEAAVDAANL